MLNQREEKELFSRIERLKEGLKKRKFIILFQRKVITILFLFIVATYGYIFIDSYLENKDKNEANDIIQNAKTQASIIITQSNNILYQSKMDYNIVISDANTEASKILLSAQQEALSKASEIINSAVNQKIDDMSALLAITEAEASNQTVVGKAAVAAVVLNRVESEKFEDNIADVVYNPTQFQPVANGTIYTALLTESTVKAVEIALSGIDYSKGALYFYNPEGSTPENCEWFETLETTIIIEDHTFKK